MSTWGLTGDQNRYLEFPPVTEGAPEVSPPDRSRIIYNANTGQLEKSVAGGAYEALISPFAPTDFTDYTVKGTIQSLIGDPERYDVLAPLSPWGATTGSVEITAIRVVPSNSVAADVSNRIDFQLDAVDATGASVLAISADFDTNGTAFTAGLAAVIADLNNTFDLATYQYIRVISTQAGAGRDLHNATFYFDCTYTEAA